MFTELSPLLKKGDTLVITVSKETDTTFRVNVIPKLFTLDGEHGEDRKALNVPVTIVGTLAELDSAEFATTLTRFTKSATGLRQTIDDVEAAQKHARESKLKPKTPAVRALPSQSRPEPAAAEAIEEVEETPAIPEPSAEPETASLDL